MKICKLGQKRFITLVPVDNLINLFCVHYLRLFVSGSPFHPVLVFTWKATTNHGIITLLAPWLFADELKSFANNNTLAYFAAEKRTKKKKVLWLENQLKLEEESPNVQMNEGRFKPQISEGNVAIPRCVSTPTHTHTHIHTHTHTHTHTYSHTPTLHSYDFS
jgi:hypothetical protein